MEALERTPGVDRAQRRRSDHAAGARSAQVLDEPSQRLEAPSDRSTCAGPEIVRTDRPIFIETRAELISRFPIVRKIEGDARFGGFAGVPVGALRVRGPRRTQPRVPSRSHGAARGSAGSSISIAHQAAIALNRIRLNDDERRARATAEHAEDLLRKLQAVSDAANAASGLDELRRGSSRSCATPSRPRARRSSCCRTTVGSCGSRGASGWTRRRPVPP